jgi:hypothetical protein
LANGNGKGDATMRTATVTLESLSPYSQSKHYTTEKLNKETSADYETRTWRDRCNVNEDGHLVIPPMAFKNCIAEVAKYLSIQIPGKGKATYTKHFEAGILVVEGVILPERKESVAGEWLHVPSDGRRGGTKRVMKCFPVVPKWSGSVTFFILDDTITPDVFEQHLREAGNFIGIGRFRPRNNGFYGRFRVASVNWA